MKPLVIAKNAQLGQEAQRYEKVKKQNFSVQLHHSILFTRLQRHNCFIYIHMYVCASFKNYELFLFVVFVILKKIHVDENFFHSIQTQKAWRNKQNTQQAIQQIYLYFSNPQEEEENAVTASTCGKYMQAAKDTDRVEFIVS